MRKHRASRWRARRPRTAFRIASELRASAEEVWAHATSFEGINAELGPVLRMSAPKELREAGIEDVVPLKQPWFRSWLLLFGVLPIDYDHLRILELAPGYLLEDSTMLTARRWRHERIVTPVDDGCRIEDRLSWEPRLRPLGWALHSVVPRLFEHRHTVLRRRFGGTRAAIDPWCRTRSVEGSRRHHRQNTPASPRT